MGEKTGIEWTDATWNPVSGCTKVSDGCKHCYAERDWHRLQHLPNYRGRAFTDVECCMDRLDQPLRWKRPRKIFVNSMSDLFHEDVPDDFILSVFDIMRQSFVGWSPSLRKLTTAHTFQILTKRPARMLDFCSRLRFDNRLFLADSAGACGFNPMKSMPKVWLGVSVENQETADERIPLLLQTPAALRWISAEPLLGPVKLKWDRWLPVSGYEQVEQDGLRTLDWVVVGGESGPKARPMHPQWARDLRDQCASFGVPFLFKQWGEWSPNCLCGGLKACRETPRPEPGKMGCMFRCGKKNAGRLLDGQLHDDYPKVTA